MGVTWTWVPTAGTTFSERRCHTALVSPNGLGVVLIGGYDAYDSLGDVWYSNYIAVDCTGTGYTKTCICADGYAGTPTNNNGIISGCSACNGMRLSLSLSLSLSIYLSISPSLPHSLSLFTYSLSFYLFSPHI